MTPFWSIETLVAPFGSLSAPSVVPNVIGGVCGGAGACRPSTNSPCWSVR